MRAVLFAVVACTAFAGVPALAGDIEGKARPVDGDSFNIEIRIHGIDTPEISQTCKNAGGEDYACGQLAASAMRSLTDGKTVTCNKQDQDTKHGRPVAVCYAAGVDLGAWMVDHGLAVAYRKYTDKYVLNEERAKAKRLGLWAGAFQMPWCYRHNETTPECFYEKMPAASKLMTFAEPQPQEVSGVCPAPRAAPPAGCDIKGNISKNGKIYHMPGKASYANTEIDPSKGERYFCSEAEALACGWRPPKG